MIARQLLAVKTQCTSHPPLLRVSGSTGQYRKEKKKKTPLRSEYLSISSISYQIHGRVMFWIFLDAVACFKEHVFQLNFDKLKA